MSKNVWMFSAILVIVVSVFLGISISDSSILSTFMKPAETEQVEVAESPWTKDGDMFSIEVAYVSPAGDETNTITLGVDGSTVTSFEMTIDTTNEASKLYQEKFISEMKQTFVGKKVAELAQIDTVAGASNTTQAFKDAVAQV